MFFFYLQRSGHSQLIDGVRINLKHETFFSFLIFSVWMNYQHEAATIATMNVFWMGVYVHTLIFNIYTGTVLVDRAKETALILHRIMCVTTDTEVLEKLYQISEMLYSRQPVGNIDRWRHFFSF